jgi:predicted short-subunit dehydrogenase-like oxidoreductase (DUF2520 family)
MKISFIGAGNVAWHMAKAFGVSNQQIVEVYSRNIKNADLICSKLYNSLPKDDLDFSKSNAEIFIITVSDDAIEEVIGDAVFPANSIVVHTSGTKSIGVLDNLTDCRTGVFYPLQTFSKSKPINFKSIPICIEANDEETEQVLEKLAFKICENVCFYNSNDRKVLHLAAVFACNFTNHLLTLSKQILEKEGLEFSVLKPLIEETIDKAMINDPEKSQTGPAVRNDQKTISEHLKMLRKDEILENIYSIMTQSILERN